MLVINRKLLTVIMLVTLSILPCLVSAQDEEFTLYENSAFTVSVPAWMEIQEEGENSALFAAEDLSIEIAAMQLSEEDQISLAEVANLTAQLPLVMEILFAESGYEAGACPSLIALPCVEFKDLQHNDGVLLRFVFADELAFYTITFRAPDEQELQRMNPNAIATSFELIGSALSSETSETTALFNVISNGAVNLRDCAGTNCAVVGQTTNGQLLPVLSQEDDWYEVPWEDGTAYIASWLTTRGPDALIDLSEVYIDPKTGCRLVLRPERGDMGFQFILAGDKRENIWIDIYRPNETIPVEVFGQYDKTFIDTEEPYIDQQYSWGTWWPTGTYRMEITFEEQTRLLAFDVLENGNQVIFVDCD